MTIKISSFDEINPELVQRSCVASEIRAIPHHECSICGEGVEWRIHDGNLYFASACGCAWSPVQPRDWRSLSDWIHMQNDEWKPKIAATCGIEIVGVDRNG